MPRDVPVFQVIFFVVFFSLTFLTMVRFG